MLTINKLHKRIDQKSILEEISFEQEPGEILDWSVVTVPVSRHC